MKDKVYTKKSKLGVIIHSDKDPSVEYANIFKLLRLVSIAAIVLGGIGTVLALIVIVAMLASGEFYDEDQLLIFIPVLLPPMFFFGLSFYISNVPKKINADWLEFCEKKQREQKAFLEKHPHYEGEILYKKCLEKKINIETVEGKARLSLIAKELEIEGTIDELIIKHQNGKAVVEQEEKKKQENEIKKKIAQAQDEEKQFVKNAERYINLRNQEKRIFMATEMIKELSMHKIALENAIHDSMNLSAKIPYQKEADWAILGGIASGIAGPAAGMAVAMDTQIKNASIRATNDNLRNLAAKAGAYEALELSGKKLEVEEHIEKWKKIAEDGKLKLTQEIKQDILLKKLSPKLEANEKSISGNYKLTVKTSATTVKIYESVDAVVDGTFKASFIADGKTIGSAYITLPYNGSESAHTLQTICLTNSDAKNFEVVFEPYNLFVIEKI